jgi:hypothetical protein
MDIAITIFKYLSLLVGTCSGVIGLLSDFRDKQTGKITKNGYRLLWLIIVSAFISLSSQTLELYRDKVKDEIAEKKSLEEAVKTNQILTDLNRTLNPIKDINVSYTIQIPLTDPRLNSYRQRLTRQLDSIMTSFSNLSFDQKRSNLRTKYGVFVTSYSTDSIFSVEFEKDSPLLPDKTSEALAFYVLQYGEVDYSFYNNSIKNISDTIRPDFHFSVTSGIINDGLEGEHKISYERNNQSLYINGFLIESTSKYWDKRGKIISIPDLAEARLIMTLLSIMVSGNDDIDKQLHEVRRGFKLENSFFKMSEGRELHFRKKAIKQINKDGDLPKYLFFFPKDLEEISSY